jgi:hypothetical protein
MPFGAFVEDLRHADQLRQAGHQHVGAQLVVEVVGEPD